jgi:hypothetical protein
MYIRKLAAAAGFATGAALAFAPLASADTTSDAASVVDSLISGVSPAATGINLDISFDGYTLYDGMGTAVANTGAAGNGLYDFAIAYGAGANATAEGGTGDYALASGTNALAHAGSLTTGATGFNYDIAEDIGNNTTDAGTTGAPDGAYAGGGSLLAGGHDSSAVSSNDSAYDIGNNGPDTSTTFPGDGGNTGAFAGDGQLIGVNGAGSGDTAYDAGNNLGFGNGPAAVDGNNNFASESGNTNGTNEGAFAAIGNNNTAIADTNYTTSGDGVSAIGGNSNYAYVYGPDNSTADAGGTSTAIGEPATLVSSNNIAYVTDPFSSTTSAADSAVAGSNGTTAGGSDLAEVLYTHGNAAAQGAPNLYDIITPFGTSATPAAAAEASAAVPAADAAAVVPITSTVSSEITSLNSQFQLDALLAGVPSTDYAQGTDGFDRIVSGDIGTVQGTGTTGFDYLTYGVDPSKAGLATDPGAFNLLNGAEIRFDEAYNVASYALLNGGALDPNSADIFGAAIPVTDTTAAEAVAAFYNDAVGDLSGFFQTSLASLDTTPAAVTELFTLFGSL